MNPEKKINRLKAKADKKLSKYFKVAATVTTATEKGESKALNRKYKNWYKTYSKYVDVQGDYKASAGKVKKDKPVKSKPEKEDKYKNFVSVGEAKKIPEPIPQAEAGDEKYKPNYERFNSPKSSISEQDDRMTPRQYKRMEKKEARAAAAAAKNWRKNQ